MHDVVAPHEILPPLMRSTQGLKTALFDALDGLRSGRTDYKEAMAVALLTTAVVRVMKIESAIEEKDKDIMANA